MKNNHRAFKVGLFVTLVLIAGSVFLLTQRFYLALPINDTPSSRIIVLDSTSKTINATPDEVSFDLKVSVDSATFSPDQSENLCLLIVNEQATEHVAKLADELDSRKKITLDNRTILLWLADKGTIGTLYASRYSCFSISNLSSGLHMITVNASTDSGIQYTESWAIQIENR